MKSDHRKKVDGFFLYYYLTVIVCLKQTKLISMVFNALKIHDFYDMLNI